MVQTKGPVGLQAHLLEPTGAWLLPGWMKRGKEWPKVREVTVPTLPCWSEHTWDVGFRARSPCGAWSLQLEDLLEPHFRSWCREACGGGRGEGAGSLIQEPMRLGGVPWQGQTLGRS